MCNNVIKNALRRLKYQEKVDFSTRLTMVRAAKRITLWVAQDGKCHYCDRETILPAHNNFKNSGLLATLDHIITQSNGGTDSLNNLVVACSTCNGNRRDMDYETFYALMKTPGGWEEHRKQLAREKAQRDEERRLASAERHRLHTLEQQNIAAINREARKLIRGGFEVGRAYKQAAEELKLPMEMARPLMMVVLAGMEKTAAKKAAQSDAKQRERIKAQCGVDGINLLRGFCHRANFVPRKEGKGWIAFQECSSMDPYPSMGLTRETEFYISDYAMA